MRKGAALEHVKRKTKRRRVQSTASMDDDCLWVFLCSEMKLKKERNAVAACVKERRDLFRLWWWEENAFSGTFRPPEIYVDKAAQADLLILIIGGTLTPNSRKEYAASVHNHRNQLIYFKEGVTLDAKTKAFKRRLKKITYWPFRNTSELRTYVAEHLRRNVVRLARIGTRAAIGTRVDYAALGLRN